MGTTIEQTMNPSLVFNEINPVDFITSESIGLSLVPFVKNEYDSFINFCENSGRFIVYTHSGEISSMEPYQYPMGLSNKIKNNFNSHLLEVDLRSIYNAIIPSLKLLTDGIIPKLMFITGGSIRVKLSSKFFIKFFSSPHSLLHQDLISYNTHTLPQINKGLCVFIIPREDYLSTYSSDKQIKGYKHKKYFKNNPQIISINMNDEEYMGIIFTNKTPHIKPLEDVTFTNFLKDLKSKFIYHIIITWNHMDTYKVPQDDLLPEINKSAIKYIDENLARGGEYDDILSSLSELSL